MLFLKDLSKSGAKVVIWDIDKTAAEEAIKKLNSKNAFYQIG